MSVYDMAEFYVHTATVEMYLGTTGTGVDLFAAPVVIACFSDDTRRLVRSSTGEQIISETTLYTYPINEAVFAQNSRVTVSGSVARVIRTNVNDSGPLDLPDNLAISLT